MPASNSFTGSSDVASPVRVVKRCSFIRRLARIYFESSKNTRTGKAKAGELIDLRAGHIARRE